MGLGERINTFRHSDLRASPSQVELLSEVRIPLADFFSILLGYAEGTGNSVYGDGNRSI